MSHPAVQRARAFILAHENDATYPLSTKIMALAEMNQEGDKERIQDLLKLLWDNQLEDGLFHYSVDGYNSHLPGSRNLPGTSDPAVDELIAIIERAEDRDSFTVAMRVLDRVLRARRDWIPNWYAANHRAAFWDMFGFREPKPDYGFPVEALWWIDEDKARAIGKA